MPGYSNTPLTKKLGIKEGFKVLVIDAPAEYQALLAPLPASVAFTKSANSSIDLAHVFATERRVLAQSLAKLRKKIDARGSRLGVLAKEVLKSSDGHNRGYDSRARVAFGLRRHQSLRSDPSVVRS